MEALSKETGIHSSIPVEHNPQGGSSFVYDERRERILTYLLERKGELRTAFKIAQACGLPTEGTQVLVRKLIKEINHFFASRNIKMFIVSTPKGFYFTDSPVVVKESIARHKIRMKGLQRTIRDEITILHLLGGSLEEEDGEVEY